MTNHTLFKYESLFKLLTRFFENTYSICALFGRYDFVIRVWSNRAHVTSFCKRVIRELLEDEIRSLLIMACDEVVYLGSSAQNHVKDLPVAEVLVRLNEAQDNQSPDAKEATRWLVRNHVYVRKLYNNLKGGRIHCFCLVSQSSIPSQAEREAKFAGITKTLEIHIENSIKPSLSLYKRTYQNVDDLQNEGSDYLITYTAPDFNSVIHVPSVLLENLMHQGLRASTSLATKTFYVDSDLAFRR